MADHAFAQTLPAAAFDRWFLSDPSALAGIRANGNLNGHRAVCGWFEYDVAVPSAGWYALAAEPSGAGHEILVDGTYTKPAGPHVGHFWLDGGVRTIRVHGLQWRGLAPLTGLRLVAVPLDAPLLQRCRLERVEVRDAFAVGATVPLRVRYGGSARAESVVLRLEDARNGEVVLTRALELPARGDAAWLDVPLVAEREGRFRVRLAVEGQPAASDTPVLAFDVIDATPVRRTGGELREQLVVEIDCAERAPDYSGGREPARVVTKPFGRYRETGAVGWLGNMNGVDPCWFAYRVELPEVQCLYRFEVSYPDDAHRTFCFAVKSGTAAYPLTVGADTGGEFALTHALRTLSVFYWARSTDVRAVLITPVSGSRAAAGRIRVYAVETPLPLPDLPAAGGRRFANWYEEGASLFGMYGAPEFRRYDNWTVDDAVLSAERFSELLAYMGGDTLFYTHAIYQFGMYPSRYNVSHNGRDTPDVVERLVLKCRKYGIGFVGEFHPEARELAWLADRADPADPHFAVSLHGLQRATDTEPIYNPLHPDNQAWTLGMLGEFADRYARHAAFRGVSLRLMTWKNPGLNNLHSLDWGYDDLSVAQFARDTGLRVPGEAGSPERFQTRHRYLTGAQREAWVAWRCARIADLHRRFVARVRQARPDLQVYVNSFFDHCDPREAGIDPALLTAAGVQLIGGTGYGRHPAIDHRRMRDRLTDPAQLSQLTASGSTNAFLFGNFYFEATPEVLTPEALGYPAGTPTGMIAGVVTPSGRHFLERYAVALAEGDAVLLADGGNTYTLGQPMLRDFLSAYRRLPDTPFAPRADARDPVAVWQHAACFYAVNREPFAVPVRVRLEGCSRVRDLASGADVTAPDGVLAFELPGYGLRVFETPPAVRIATVAAEVPAGELALAQRRAAWASRFAGDVQAGRTGAELGAPDRELLAAAAAEAQRCAVEGRTWRLRTLLAAAPLQRIYETANRFPPALADDGPPETPAGALAAEAISAAADLPMTCMPAAAADPHWTHAMLAVTDPSDSSDRSDLSFDIPVPAPGRYQIRVAHAAGGAFGTVAVAVNGEPVGKLSGDGAVPVGTLTVLESQPALRPPEARVTLTRLAGERMGVAFVQLRPVMRTLRAHDWLVAGPYVFHTGGGALTTEAVDRAMRETVFPAEVSRDFTAPVSLDGGATGRWVAPEGSGDFVDLGRTLQRMRGSVSYAVTHLQVPAAATVRLTYGVDYWIRIWVGGRLVADCPQHGGAPIKNRFETHVDLAPGWNKVRVKVGSGSLGNGFWMAVSDPGGLRVDAAGGGDR